MTTTHHEFDYEICNSRIRPIAEELIKNTKNCAISIRKKFSLSLITNPEEIRKK